MSILSVRGKVRVVERVEGAFCGNDLIAVPSSCRSGVHSLSCCLLVDAPAAGPILCDFEIIKS